MKVNVKGTVISNEYKRMYDYFGIDNVCPADIHKAIDNADGELLDVYINSGGGEIFAATEIYDTLRAYNGECHIHVTGFAGSAASVIMCAADCDITPTSMVMIHNVSGSANGDYNVMNKQSEILQTANKAICSAYTNKTGKEEKDLLSLMNKETWLTAKQAVELGLCDRVSCTNTTLTNAYCTMLTAEQIEEYKNAGQKVQATINLLKEKVIEE